MSLPNRIPELDQNLVSSNKTVYCLQEITKYDEGYSESHIVGIWDSPNGDIDKATQNVIKQNKEFCEYNKFVKPYTMTVRKVKMTISQEVIESRYDHYGLQVKPKILMCSNCNGNINYGDSLVVKHYDTCDRYFCCNDCLAEFEDADKYSPEDESQYNKLFGIEDD